MASVATRVAVSTAPAPWASISPRIGVPWQLSFSSKDKIRLTATSGGETFHRELPADTDCDALTEAAAAMMGVPANELVVRESRISHAKSKKSMSFADIVKSGKATKTFTPDELKALKLKTPDQYTLVGVSVPQLDIPSKSNGTAKYGIDTMLPGMEIGRAHV